MEEGGGRGVGAVKVAGLVAGEGRSTDALLRGRALGELRAGSPGNCSGCGRTKEDLTSARERRVERSGGGAGGERCGPIATTTPPGLPQSGRTAE